MARKPFSIFTITFLDRHKTAFIEIADILRFSANITKETLIASIRLLIHALCFILADFLLIHARHNRYPPDTAFPQIDVLNVPLNPFLWISFLKHLNLIEYTPLNILLASGASKGIKTSRPDSLIISPNASNSLSKTNKHISRSSGYNYNTFREELY